MLKDNAQGTALNCSAGPNDPAVFQYSGGTTGTPKCAIGLHCNLVANELQFSHWLVNTRPGEETVLVAIPIYHVYGMVLGMNLSVWMGGRMVLIPDPRDLVGLLEAIQKYQATVFPGVPSLYAAINRFPAVIEGKYDLSSIKACISGSTTLPLKVKQAFEALTNGHLVEGMASQKRLQRRTAIRSWVKTGMVRLGCLFQAWNVKLLTLSKAPGVWALTRQGIDYSRASDLAGNNDQPEETKLVCGMDGCIREMSPEWIQTGISISWIGKKM